MHALARGGADGIELGLPLADPIADGPTIQAAIEWALESAHAVAYVKKAAETGELGDVVVINLSGRGGQGCGLCCEAGGILRTHSILYP